MNNRETKEKMFDYMAGHYDLFNHMSSMGADLWWRFRLSRQVPAKSLVLDVGSGSGEIFATLRKKSVRCVGIDPSRGMLEKGRAKHGTKLMLIQGEGEHLPFAENSFDCVVSAFVMRNVASIGVCLADAYRVLRKGGRLIVTDFFPPRRKLPAAFFRVYLGRVLPAAYHLFTGRGEYVRYLHESIFQFVEAEHFVGLVKEAGFDNVRCNSPFLNLARCITAEKPQSPV